MAPNLQTVNLRLSWKGMTLRSTELGRGGNRYGLARDNGLEQISAGASNFSLPTATTRFNSFSRGP